MAPIRYNPRFEESVARPAGFPCETGKFVKLGAKPVSMELVVEGGKTYCVCGTKKVEVNVLSKYRIAATDESETSQFVVISRDELLQTKPNGEVAYWARAADFSRVHLRRFLADEGAKVELPSAADKKLSAEDKKDFVEDGLLFIPGFFSDDLVELMRLAITSELGKIPSAGAYSVTCEAFVRCLTQPAIQMIAEALGKEETDFIVPKAVAVYNNKDVETDAFDDYQGRLREFPVRKIQGVYDGRDPLVPSGDLMIPGAWVGVILDDQLNTDEGNFVFYPKSHKVMEKTIKDRGDESSMIFSEDKPLTEGARYYSFPVTDCSAPRLVKAKKGSLVISHGLTIWGFQRSLASYKLNCVIPLYQVEKAQTGFASLFR